MSTDIKGFLYGWLGKNKKVVPVYDYQTATRGGIQRFKCELRVPGFTYIGIGNSQSKKDAASNAARDFCQFLVRNGDLQEAEIPSFDASSLEATSAHETISSSNYGSTSQPSVKMESEFTGVCPPYQRVGQLHEQSRHDQYIQQRANEVAQSESADLRSEIHGGWTMENAKAALHEFAAKVKAPALQFNTRAADGVTASHTFVSDCSLYVPQLHKSLSGRGQGSTKKVAEFSCALSIVRQLYHLGVLKEYNGIRKKIDATTLPSLNVDLPRELIAEVDVYLSEQGIHPAKVPEDVSPEKPCSLFPESSQFSAFEDSDPAASFKSTVCWAPAMQNWDPWRAVNIDDPELSFMSLDQISKKLAECETQKTKISHIAQERINLPVHNHKQEILEMVERNEIVVIKGETGCGKSTQVAQYILEEAIGRGKGAHTCIYVSQPRRISAISLCERVADERGENPGESVGYGVRFDAVIPRPYGSIMFVTVGLLLKKMEAGLRGVSHVIIDEIHERDISVWSKNYFLTQKCFGLISC